VKKYIATMKKNLILLFVASLIFAACSKDYDVLPSVGTITLTADSSVKITGENITFTVKDNNGVDFTPEAVILVDDAPIEGNTYTNDVVSTHTVKATYAGLTSEPVTIRFHDGTEVNFVKRALVEDYTGTWCGYCPRVAHSIEEAKAQSDKIVPVAIHRASSNPNSSIYDPYNYDTQELEDFIAVVGYPKGMLNRITQWKFPENENVGQAIALTQGDNPKLGLAISSTVSGNNVSVTVDTKFSKDFSDLKLVVYLLENGLVHEQHNYTDFYGGVSVIADFEHNHVLREPLTPLLGEAVTGATTSGKVYSKTYSIAMPGNVTNGAKVEFVAFMVDASGNAINVRKAAIGETQTFEEL
jgi:thiol-disulfide isomerase/thioredoxin